MLAIMVRYAAIKLVTPATMTLLTQAQSVADFVRRAQGLAMTRGQRMSVRVATSGMNGRYALACVTGTTPCNTDATLSMDQGVVVGNASTVYFNSLGQPVNNSTGVPLSTNSSFTLSFATAGNTVTYTITVAALSGRVSISP
jgi:hypothetical protein